MRGKRRHEHIRVLSPQRAHPAGLYVDCEDAVGAGGGLVHGRLADGAIGIPQEQLHTAGPIRAHEGT